MNLVDTDVLIEYQRGMPRARHWFASVAEPPSVPGFVAMELIQDALNIAQVRQIEKMLDSLRIVWPTENDCSSALANFGRMNRSHGTGLIDSLIAACAVGRNATLYTFNVRHFRGYPGLQIQRPYAR